MEEPGKEKCPGKAEYNPETYWNGRASRRSQDCLSTVCIHEATSVENRCAHRVQEKVIRRMMSGMDLEGKEILEYGCGAGRWIPYFRKYRGIWHGVDISENMLSLARDVDERAVLSKVSDGVIPYPDSCMDFVYSVTVLHHNSYDDQTHIASEMSRVLRKNGYLLILEDIGEKGVRYNMYPRPLSSWADLFQGQGLTLVRVHRLRYWIVRGVVMKVISALGRILGRTRKDADGEPRAGNKSLPSAIANLIARIDMMIDPYIYPIVPSRYRGTAVLLFHNNR